MQRRSKLGKTAIQGMNTLLEIITTQGKSMKHFLMVLLTLLSQMPVGPCWLRWMPLSLYKQARLTGGPVVNVG